MDCGEEHDEVEEIEGHECEGEGQISRQKVSFQKNNNTMSGRGALLSAIRVSVANFRNYYPSSHHVCLQPTC